MISPHIRGRRLLPLPAGTFAKRPSSSPAGVRCQSLQGDAALHPLQGDLCVTQPKGRVHSVNLIKAPPLFTLSKGRGEFWRLRQKKVRGLPRNQARVTQRSLQGERQIRASSAEIGEGSSGQPPPSYAEVSGSKTIARRVFAAHEQNMTHFWLDARVPETSP